MTGTGGSAGRGRRIIIAAGGTGGHLTPAAALADELSKRGHTVTLMCDARSSALADRLFAAHERIVLPGEGVAGRTIAGAAKGALTLLAATPRARTVLAASRPAAVIGFGSYPSVGPVLAARLLPRRPKIILHEQNAVMGGANRMLARLADALALSHAATARVPAGARTIVTGNPVRAEIIAAATAFSAPVAALRVLVLGGSQGARAFSDVVPAAVARLPEDQRARLRITQQCRPEDLDRVRAAYAACGATAELAPFFADVATKLAECHLVISRSGASTVAELGVIGRPAILVPLPGAVDGDQMLNARTFADGGGGWLMPQLEFTADALADRLSGLIADPAALAAAAARAEKLGHADAASRLADVVEQTIGQETQA